MTSRETILCIAAITAIVLLTRWGCQEQHRADLNGQAADEYADTAKIERDKSGWMIASNEAIRVQSKEGIENAMREKKELQVLLKKYKSVANATVVRTELRIDSVKVLLRDTLPCPDFLPVPFNIDSPWYKIYGTVGKNELTIGSLSLPNEMFLVIGEKRLGFLKGTDYSVSVVNSNPYMNVGGIKSYSIVKPKKWWETQAAALGLGLIGGVVIGR